MRFEVKHQVFDCKPDGGVFDSATVAISDVRKVEKAVQRMGLGYEVKAANDGSVKFRANDLSLDTIIETQRHGEMELRDLIAHAAFVQTKHMRCQSPFRASTSFATNSTPWRNDTSAFQRQRFPSRALSEQPSPCAPLVDT